MRRRFFAPEVIQTSAMDCGPAALLCLLQGHGIEASYGRLREACQTGVDGTSIDALEEAAVELGLEAEQVMVPVDHLLSGKAPQLPAMVIVKQPGGLTHFVVVWRKHGRWLQIMDPAVGRRWVSAKQFLETVYRHSQAVPVDAWQDWASGESFLAPLRERIRGVGRVNGELVREAAGSAGKLARLDAATRMAESLVGCGALDAGSAAGLLLERLAGGEQRLPDHFWSAALPADGGDELTMRGAVLLRVTGVRANTVGPASLELAAALQEKPARPFWTLGKILMERGGWLPVAIVGALAGEALGAVLEALLFRGVLDIGRELSISGQRLGALGALATLSILLLGLEYLTAGGLRGLGRQLEAEIRVRFLSKLPRLSDRYFQSRPISDMASRSHQAQRLREAPPLGAAFLRAVMEMVVTTLGIAWLYPEAAPAATLLAAASIGIPLAAQPGLAERDLRTRSHAGALTQFYLDAMQGLTAIRAHGAERAMRRAQSTLLGAWAEAALSMQRMVAGVEGLQMTVGFGLAAWIVWNKLAEGGEAGGVLLLVYWAMQLPMLGREAAGLAWQYPGLRNTTLRILEPLGAPEEPRSGDSVDAGTRNSRGAEIRLEQLRVRAGGHVILDDIDLTITAGSHVAVVGASGAGKSSLAGVLMGWHRAESGMVRVDGEPLDGTTLGRLRAETAWIDPQVQLWNGTLFQNLRYGVEADGEVGMNQILDDAQLGGLLEKLPEGYQTVIGEGGGLLSGGEGQRVRTGRAMGRRPARLVILDEPARGLDAEARRKTMAAARRRWKDATLLAITHDLAETKLFERVVVIDAGRVAEDGRPEELAARPGSIYRRLLDAEENVKSGAWASGKWRRLTIAKGRVVEQERGS